MLWTLVLLSRISIHTNLDLGPLNAMDSSWSFLWFREAHGRLRVQIERAGHSADLKHGESFTQSTCRNTFTMLRGWALPNNDERVMLSLLSSMKQALQWENHRFHLWRALGDSFQTAYLSHPQVSQPVLRENRGSEHQERVRKKAVAPFGSLAVWHVVCLDVKLWKSLCAW